MLHADSVGSLSRAPLSQTSVLSGHGQLGESTRHLKEMPQAMFKHVGFVLCHLVNSAECGLHFSGCEVNSQEILSGEIMTCNRFKATLSH